MGYRVRATGCREVGSWFLALCLAGLCIGAGAQETADGDGLREVRLANDAFRRDPTPPAWARLAPAPAPQSSGVTTQILLAETQAQVAATPSWIVHRVTQAHDARELSRLGQVMLQFNPSYQRLALHRLAILRGDQTIDHTATAPVRFLQRETQLESGVYSGTITASLLLPDVRVGDALQLMFSVEGSNPILGDRYSDLFGWDDSMPIAHRRISVVAPVDRRLRWQWVGDAPARDLPSPIETVEHGQRWLTFESHQLAPAILEPQLASYARPFRTLQISEYSDWSELANWAAGLFAANSPLPDELETWVERWRALPDDAAKASEALQWVQQSIRYHSISLGESSHRPQPPSAVLQQRYGDCKDKSLLLVTILRALGIEADPVLVSLRHRKAVSGWLPAPDIFDHAVVRVRLGEHAYFLDPTRLGQVGPLDRMGQTLEDAEVLVVQGRDAGPAVVRSPQRQQIFLSDLKERFILERFDAPGRLEVTWAFHGLGAESIRLRLMDMTAERRREWAMRDYERRHPGIELEADPQFRDQVDLNRIEMTMSFRVPNLAQSMERGDWVVRYVPATLMGSLALPERLTRTFPLGMSHYPMTLNYEASVRWPDTVSVMSNPSTRLVENAAFVARVESTALGNDARMRVRLEVRRPEVNARDLFALAEDVRRFDREVAGAFWVDKSQIKLVQAGGQGSEGFRERFLRQMREMVDETSKTIDGGGLSEQDLVEALCTRSAALHELGEDARGFKDSDAAVRRVPQSGEAWSCRASSQFRQGRFEAAVSDYSKAMVLGHPRGDALYWRAIARYYAGQVAQAASDFRQAVEAKTDESERAYAQLWWFWTSQQAGLPIPDALRQIAADRRGDLWPAPALALQAGLIGQDELLELARAKGGDAGELGLAEAWFYIGQWHKSQGRLDDALTAFRKTVALNATMYLEHLAAQFELR